MATGTNVGQWCVRYMDGHGDTLERVTFGKLVLKTEANGGGWAMVLDADTNSVLHAVWAENLVEAIPGVVAA